MKSTFLLILITGLFLIGTISAQTNRPKTKRAQQTKAQMSDNVNYEPDAEMLRELQVKVRVIDSKKDWAQFNRQSPSVNPVRTRAAYVAQFKMKETPDALFDVIVVHDQATDKMFEIRGVEDFPWRPLSDLKWLSSDVLQFDQWVNPNNGGRYQVNLKTGKIVGAGYIRSN